MKQIPNHLLHLTLRVNIVLGVAASHVWTEESKSR